MLWKMLNYEGNIKELLAFLTQKTAILYKQLIIKLIVKKTVISDRNIDLSDVSILGSVFASLDG
jgi:hypothetical protein